MALNLKGIKKNIFNQSNRDETGLRNGNPVLSLIDAEVSSIYNSDLSEQDLTTSYQIINGLTGTIRLDQDSYCLVIYSGEFNGLTTINADVIIDIDGTPQTKTTRRMGGVTTFINFTQGIFELKAGTHTISIKAKQSAGTTGDLVSGDNGEMNIIIFRKNK